MKRVIFVFYLFFLGNLAMAQQDTTKISISFNEISIESVFAKIEESTHYQFYYLNDWLVDKSASGNFKEATLNQILDKLFKDTSLNFYVLNDKKVILSKNNIIYDELPGGFFKKGIQDTLITISEAPQENIFTPVFYGQNSTDEILEVETVRIGKESLRNGQKNYRLSGYIKNLETGRPIRDLTLLVRNGKIGTVTNVDGYYEIDLPPGLNILETKALGVKSQQKRVIIYSDGQLDFDLEEGIEQLDEVVVEADQRKNVEEEITGTTIIVAEESKDIPLVLGERNILSVATKLPGITNAGEGATGLNVRGGKTDQNLVLLDNSVIYNPTHFFGIFQALNPFVTKGVQIYKGNIPVEFGGRLSSVFDISTIDGNKEKFTGEASIGPVTSNIALQIPIVEEKSSLVIGGRGAYSDWILRSLENEDLKNSEASFYDVIANYTHEIDENNSIKATGHYSKDSFSITTDSLHQYSNRLFSLEWNHRFNEKNSGHLLFNNSEYAFEIDYDGLSNNDFNLGYSIDETELKLKLNYLPDSLHTIDYGLSAKLYSIKPGYIEPLGSESVINSSSIPKERGLEAAIFLGDNFQVTEKLGLSAGIRYSLFAALGESEQRNYIADQPKNEGTFLGTTSYGKNEVIETYGGPEIRASARYLFTPDFSVKASYNSMYQYIHTLSNTTTVSPIDTWKLSDSNIEPQKGSQYSLGFFKNFDDNNYELSLEGYYKKSTDILDFKTGAQLLLNDQIETEVLQGEGRAYGLEFLLRKNSGRINGWLGYTYSRSEIRFDGQFAEERINEGAYFPSNYDKPHDLSLVANYKFTRRYSASVNFSYQTGRPITYPIGQYNFRDSEYVFYSNRNEFRIPDYYRLDIGINIEGNHKIKKFAHSFWNVSVYNVLGRANPYSVFFVSEQGEVKAYKSSIFSIPIPSITYNFKF
ncbi:TonB-dependent receptor [Maribacter sp. HTCC2170]|uniref:TonB-dependent receptor n=1 Tax=Maribacter sp. (strain HTCC2170 / KCCM 42371) TaxID=313603 RepID=UPI001ED92D11|nr:TonB-dependent receptor [Maribacter sp. HTCC2170]